MTSPTIAPAEVALEELPEPPCSPQLVEEMLRNFARAIKTHQLYLPNNPIYSRAIDSLRAAFATIWPHTPDVVLTITESDFRWMGRSVMHEASRSESLPWVFFKDGVRELTLSQGIESEELTSLLHILQRVRNAAPEEDDLLTLMWEQEFTRLAYRFVDINLDPHASFDASAEPPKERRLPIVEDIRRGGGRGAEANVGYRAPRGPRCNALLSRRTGDRLSALGGRGRPDDRHAAQRAGDPPRYFRGAGGREGSRGDLRHSRELHAQLAGRRRVRIGWRICWPSRTSWSGARRICCRRTSFDSPHSRRA